MDGWMDGCFLTGIPSLSVEAKSLTYIHVYGCYICAMSFKRVIQATEFRNATTFYDYITHTYPACSMPANS